MNSSETQSTQLRVVIVEDHELARFGLSMALAERDTIAVVGEAENGKKGVETVLSLKPDVVLMDIGMPVMNGITATQEIKAKLPDTKVVMLTSMNNPEEVLASLSAGADAYCMKEIKIERLHQVLDMVMEGAIWLDPAIARLVTQSLPGNVQVQDVKPHSQPKRRYNAQLTEREQEVLKLIVAGKSNKEIAQVLDVTSHTAKAHVANIIQKLAVDDRTQVAVKALKEGLIE
jgi:DNA-binding NarL/FixJ family response regulator